jgi:hypothetical protein
MPKRSHILATAALLSLSLPAQAEETLMPVTAIQRGMEGTCRTVFQGKTVEPFGFKVLSLMQGMLGPGQDVILTRLTGEKAEFTGVVAGMSGSPCYINGKLIGALAYRFGNFTKEPIAGITPIQNMLDIFKLPSAPNKMAPKTVYTPQSYRSNLNHLQKAQSLSSSGMQPIATPLSFGGFRSDVLAQYQTDLEKLGFQAVLGGLSSPSSGSIANPDTPQSLEMGGAVAGQLVRGDLSIDGTGTVSYIDKNRVLAFGHPFFNEGYVQIPMATAYIHHILSSEAGSYKMSQSGVEVGTIVQDRLTAIYGEIGKRTPMIPMHIQVKDTAQVDPSQLKLEVFQSPTMTPMLMAMSIHNVLTSRLNFNQGGTLVLEGNINVDGKKIQFQNDYAVAAGEDVVVTAVQDLAGSLFALWRNPYQKPDIRGLELKVTLKPQFQQAQINRIWTDSDEVSPGEAITLHVELSNWRNEKVIRNFKVQIPAETPYGELSLLASDARSLDALEASVNTGFSGYDDLLEHLFSQRKNTDLHFILITDEGGIAQQSNLMPKLPASVQELLFTAETESMTIPIRSPGSEQKIATGSDLVGNASLKLYVTAHAKAIN